ncbi:hypothetical protein EZE20_13935 [Arundinibacter roseus]|uniref:Uncharacterized protein n=2 Tax=Arundinibacter roseus TaxID=2070510 RepID=A0A4R4KC34_9BACT|nr:hypothetical protein EZE20_13935 [Arundinibacter roseus]
MPLLMAGVTLSVRRWGAAIGGWIGGFPWVAGPISFFMAWEQGAPFVANTIPGALMGSAGTILFAYSYARLSTRWSWLPTVLVSYGVFFTIAFLSLQWTPSLWQALGLNLATLTLILYLFPKPEFKAVVSKQRRYDIPLRMVVATLFVLALTQAAERLGPTWSGLLTPFPIMTSILAVFTHVQQGSAATARIMYGLLLAGYGFTTFLTGVYFLVPMLPIGWAYFILTLGTLVLNGIAFKLIR